MILIDKSFFQDELSLPNIEVQQPATSGVDLALQTVGENNLDVFADKYIIDYLIRLFGRDLAFAFLEGLEEKTGYEFSNDFNSDFLSGKWIRLKDILVVSYGRYKLSPLACYVYYWLMRDARSKTTQAGEAVSKFDYGDAVSSEYKMVKAWNDMARMTREVYHWFCIHKDYYSEYYHCNCQKSAYNLMRPINTFGI